MLIDHRTPDDPRLETYAARVNRAIDHVLRHLDTPPRLEEVAAVANFSPFHFHRVFRALMGETLGQFVKRVRLERALSLMARSPRRSLTDIALDCGFSSSSDFTRSFKQRWGVPPSAFDIDAWRRANRDVLERTVDASEHHHLSPALEPGENPDGFAVRLRDLPARRVAYIRVLDPFRGNGVMEAYERLIAWAEQRGAADGQWLGYMWDDPEIVDLARCRYDVGVVLDGDVAPDGDVSVFDFPPMRVAEVEIRGDLALEQRALDWLFRTWLPSSGFLPGDQPCFEAWHGRPFAHGTTHFELSAHVPVVRG